MTTQQAEKKPILRNATLPGLGVPEQITAVAHQALIRMIVDLEAPHQTATKEQRHALGAQLIGLGVQELATRWHDARPNAPIISYRMGEIDSKADRALSGPLAEHGVDGILIFTQTEGPRIALFNDAGMALAEEQSRFWDERPLDETDGLPRDGEPGDYESHWTE